MVILLEIKPIKLEVLEKKQVALRIILPTTAAINILAFMIILPTT